jgi:chemotaxis signal transduction protein
MSTRFRSISNLATRRRARVAVERTSYVVVSLGTGHFALPVELVERVLRPSHDIPMAVYGGHHLPFVDIAAPLGRTLGAGIAAMRRVLVLHDGDRWWAAPVDAVHDVVAIETATVALIDADDADAAHPAVRATFLRHAQRVLVIDPLRLLP